MAMLGKLIGRSLGDDEGLEVNELLKDARETTDWAAKAREGFSPITKGDKEIQRFFRPRSPTNQEGREYWPGVPFAKLGVKLQCAKLQHERFHIDQVKEGQKPDQDDLFPNRHRVNEEWDDWAMELAWDQTGKKKKKAKKRYSFSKADVEALEAEAKGGRGRSFLRRAVGGCWRRLGMGGIERRCNSGHVNNWLPGMTFFADPRIVAIRTLRARSRTLQTT